MQNTREQKGWYCEEILASTGWSCTAHSLISPHYRLVSEVGHVVGSFEPQDIANTLWALATAGVQMPASLVESLSKRAESTARDFNPQAIANTLWASDVGDALSVDWILSLPLVRHLLRLVLEGQSTLSYLNLMQLHQFFSSIKCGIFCADELREIFDDDEIKVVVEQCRSTFIQQSDAGSSVSRLQKDVAHTVRSVFGGHPDVKVSEEQVLEHACGYSVDIQLIGWQQKVVLEVDGPSHFLRALGQSAPPGPDLWNGNTRFKHRLLSSCGLRVLHVPYSDWDNLRLEHRESYIRRLFSL